MAEDNENVTVENGEQPAPALKKFGSVDALVCAYEQLEAEFTRRSQRLKELEKRSKEQEELLNSQTEAPSERTQSESDELLYRNVVQNEGVRARVLSDYLSSLKGVPLMTGAGTGVIAPPNKPKSISEAGSLALNYLKSKK